MAAQLEARGFVVDAIGVPDDAPLRGFPAAFLLPKSLSRYDLIASSEYRISWAILLRLLLTGCRTRLVVIGMNLSASPIKSGFRPIDLLLDRVWRRAAAFVVHSHAEADLFASLHAIPRDRFVFSHWGYDLPARGDGVYRPAFPHYVSMIGRNNRDIALFCDAVARAGASGIVVTSARALRELSCAIPDTVRIETDLPMELCVSIIEQSFAHLVLVLDAERGAGHISAVTGMLLGKPQIFSDVPTLADYFSDGLNGLAVPVGDAKATADAIERLAGDALLANGLGSRGNRIAKAQMSHIAASERVADICLAIVGGERLPAEQNLSS